MNSNQIAECIKEKQSPETNKPLLIAIEGYGGSGKSTLAEELKSKLPNSEVIKIDSFIKKGKAQDAEPWEDVFDRIRLRRQVLEPASRGSIVSYQRLDWANNTLGDNITLPHVDYLIIDGITSFHPDIEHYYNFKIWVETPIEVARQRGQQRDSGNENSKLWEKWAQCDLVYQEEYHPEKRANFIVSN